MGYSFRKRNGFIEVEIFQLSLTVADLIDTGGYPTYGEDYDDSDRDLERTLLPFVFHLNHLIMDTQLLQVFLHFFL